MKYQGFLIKNFQGVKELSLDFSKNGGVNIFTFVGINESGKTTILEALDFFQKDLPREQRHVLIPRSKKRNFNDSISVEAGFLLNQTDEDSIKSYAKEFGFIIEKPIHQFTVRKEYAFKSSEFVNEDLVWDINIIGRQGRSRVPRKLEKDDTSFTSIVAHIKTLFPPIIYYPNFLFDFPARIFLETFEGETKEQEFYRGVLQDVLDSLDDESNLTEHVLNRMRADSDESQEALDSTLHSMGAVITHKILKHWETLFKSRGREIIVKAGRESKDGLDRFYLETRLKEGAEASQISENSLGFKWFFAFRLFTEFRKDRAKDKGEILFVLDEPASNLHSTAQMKLISTFRQLVSKSKLIYTTHSHHLINPEWLSGAFIVKNQALDPNDEISYDSRKTDIIAVPYRQFVAQHPDQQTYFQPILDSLEYKPSQLEMVPSIVIVEGKGDFYTLKYANAMLLENKFSELNLYPGNGAGKNDRVVRLYNSWNRKFLVLMDSDSAGVEGKKKYLREVGQVVEDKIFTLRDINSRWRSISTEDLLTKAERMRLIKAFDPRARQYSKAKFYDAIEQLLFLKILVNVSDTTKQRFSQVFEFLKDKLK